MLSKIQKIWLWIFGTMFLLPEIFFSLIPLSITNLLGGNFNSLYSIGVENYFLGDNIIYLLIAIITEWIGVLGLFVLCIKLKKKIFALLSVIVLLWLFIVFCYIIAISSTSF